MKASFVVHVKDYHRATDSANVTRQITGSDAYPVVSGLDLSDDLPGAVRDKLYASIDEFLEKAYAAEAYWHLPGQNADSGLPSSPSAAEDPPAGGTTMVSFRLYDLSKIANSVVTLMHDLDNGKYKYVHGEIDIIHGVIERWATDFSVLGDGCHDHRCRLCRQSTGYRPA